MRRLLKERADALFEEGRIKKEVYDHYISVYDRYTIMMKDYRH